MPYSPSFICLLGMGLRGLARCEPSSSNRQLKKRTQSLPNLHAENSASWMAGYYRVGVDLCSRGRAWSTVNTNKTWWRRIKKIEGREPEKAQLETPTLLRPRSRGRRRQCLFSTVCDCLLSSTILLSIAIVATSAVRKGECEDTSNLHTRPSEAFTTQRRCRMTWLALHGPISPISARKLLFSQKTIQSWRN